MIKPIKSRDKDACVTSAQGGMCCCCVGVKCSNVDVVLVSTIWDLSSVRIFDIAPNYAWPAQQRHARSRPGMGLCQNIFNFWEINATMKHFIMELYQSTAIITLAGCSLSLLGVSRHIFCSVAICMWVVKLPCLARVVLVSVGGAGWVTRAAASLGRAWPVTSVIPVICMASI